MSTSATGGLRVVSMNLFGRRQRWAERRQVVRDGLRRLQPDLMGLQEAIRTEEYDQAADVLGPGFHLAHQTVREPGDPPDVETGQGFTIASRWPIQDIHELDLHVSDRTRDFACGALVADIITPDPIGRLLFVYHNPSWKLNLAYEREQQAVATARFIDALQDGDTPHVVVVGDLDADPAAASTRFWTGRQSLDGKSVCYRDAWESAHPDLPGHTFTPNNPLMNAWDWPFRRIDYLLIGCGTHGGPTLAIRSCERIFDQPVEGVWASDHFGLVADLSIP